MKKGRRLSASAERFDLEYSLGSLDDLSVPSFAASAKRKKMTSIMPMGSLGEAMMPKFWQDSASVSENNIASASFDVAEEEGGSSPLSVEGAGVPVVEKSSSKESRHLNDEEKRGIKEAEQVMKLATLAAQPDNSLAANGASLVMAEFKEKIAEPFRENDVDDFATHIQDDIQDNDSDYSNNFSSTSSFVESCMPEDKYSMHLPPAPPSTPAAPREAHLPLSFQACVTSGELSYGDELRHELKGNMATRPHHDNDFPLPLYSRKEDKTQLPEESIPSRSRLSQKYHTDALPPDISGAVTEPRRGNSNHAGNQRPRQSTMTDFDKWNVGDRYQLKRILGRGSYGVVAQAIDLQAVASHQKTEGAHNSPQQSRSAYVAVKKISNAFDQEVDAIRLFREMHILRRLRGHACVIQLVDVIRPHSSDLEHFHDLYLVFEYVDTDLYKLIMSPQYLTTEHIQTFLYQMLVGLKYIHCSSVIHRDLKPAILLNEDCTLKICDFGLARIVRNEKITLPAGVLRADTNDLINSSSTQATVQEVVDDALLPNLSRQLTKHVVTRWYRAPELILIQPYASAVDIWSLGCIFAELLSMQEGSVPNYQDRVPLFPGGSCYPLSGDHVSTDTKERQDQLSVIFSVIGMPSEEDLMSVGKANEYIRTLEKKPGRSLESLFPAADPEAINLLKTMLMFNPAKRCTAEEALDHEFLQPVRKKDLEFCATQPLESPNFLEKNRVDIATLKKEAYKEVMWYQQHP
ncbi:hypothetical protein ACHAXA_010598 [Cyclostephanos tholiformis]|uniref:Protein kinase domain-containing protein n=1 Tax=Cyclostephanos tholiformis TaxID=382380 RepID=A0ABD3RZC6_9STRA